MVTDAERALFIRRINAATGLSCGEAIVNAIVKLSQANVTISSAPPADLKKVLNIYIEPESGKMVVIHEE